MKTSKRSPFKVLGLLGVALIVAMVALVGIMSFGAKSALAAINAQICFAVDGSGSMTLAEFNLEKGGIAAAIQNGTIPQDGTVEVTVLQFSNGAKAPTVNNVVITAGNAAATAALVNAMVFQNGPATTIGTAIKACTTEITGSANFATAGTQAINVATNGQNNSGQTPATAATAAQAAGIDRLDFEAVGSPSVTAILAAAFPGPSEKVAPGGSPVGPQPRGFVMNVNTFADFEAAIAVKIPIVIGPTDTPTPTVTPTPTDFKPGSVPLGGSGLFPDVPGAGGSSGTGYGIVAGVLAAVAVGALGLGGAAWYGRRRWIR